VTGDGRLCFLETGVVGWFACDNRSDRRTFLDDSLSSVA